MDDVVEARSFLDAVGLANTKIFAKLESRQSLLNFKGILNEADGIIISRWGCSVWQHQLNTQTGECLGQIKLALQRKGV